MDAERDRYRVPLVDGFTTKEAVYVIRRQEIEDPIACASSWNAACAYFELHGMEFESEPGDDYIEAFDSTNERWHAIRMAPVCYSSPQSRAHKGRALRSFVKAIGPLREDWREILGEEE